MYDELLRLSGSTGNAEETITTTTTGTGKFVGYKVPFEVEVRFAGAVTGTSPSAVVKLQDSVDGVTYADMGVTFDAVTTTMTASRSRFWTATSVPRTVNVPSCNLALSRMATMMTPPSSMLSPPVTRIGRSGVGSARVCPSRR